MPLRRGHSNETISDNVKRLMHEGHSAKRAVAIALSHARKSSNKRRRTRKSLFISTDAKLIKADKGGKKRAPLTDPQYDLGDEFFEDLDLQLQKPKESKSPPKKSITQREKDIDFIKNTSLSTHFKSWNAIKRYQKTMARLGVVAPKLPGRLKRGGLTAKAVTEWKNFVDALSGSKGTKRSRALALDRGILNLYTNEKPLEIDTKKYLESVGYKSPLERKKAKKIALEAFYRGGGRTEQPTTSPKKYTIGGHEERPTPSTSGELRKLQAKSPSGTVITTKEPKASRLRRLAREGKLGDIPQEPTGWVGKVKDILGLFRDTEGVTKTKTGGNKSMFISAEDSLSKAASGALSPKAASGLRERLGNLSGDSERKGPGSLFSKEELKELRTNSELRNWAKPTWDERRWNQFLNSMSQSTPGKLFLQSRSVFSPLKSAVKIKSSEKKSTPWKPIPARTVQVTSSGKGDKGSKPGKSSSVGSTGKEKVGKSIFISAEARLRKGDDVLKPDWEKIRKWLSGFKGVSGDKFKVRYDPSKVTVKELHAAQPQGATWAYTDITKVTPEVTSKVTPKVTPQITPVKSGGTPSGRRYLSPNPELKRSMFISAEDRLSKASPPVPAVEDVKKTPFTVPLETPYQETLQDVVNVALMRDKEGNLISPANIKDLNKIYRGFLGGKLKLSNAQLKSLKLFDKVNKFLKPKSRDVLLGRLDSPPKTDVTQAELGPQRTSLVSAKREIAEYEAIPEKNRRFFTRPNEAYATVTTSGGKSPTGGGGAYSTHTRLGNFRKRPSFVKRVAALKSSVGEKKAVVKVKPVKSATPVVGRTPATESLKQSLFISSNIYFEKGAISQWSDLKDNLLEEFIKQKAKKPKVKKGLGLYVSSDAVLEKGKVLDWFLGLLNLNPYKKGKRGGSTRKLFKDWRKKQKAKKKRKTSAVDPFKKDPKIQVEKVNV